MLSNRLRGTDLIGRNRLTGAEARGSGEIGYWNALINKTNAQNMAKQDRLNRFERGIDTTVGAATSYFAPSGGGA